MSKSERTPPTDLPVLPEALFVAVRSPPFHVAFHLMFDDPAAYESICERVLASVRETLDEMGVSVIETMTVAS